MFIKIGDDRPVFIHVDTIEQVTTDEDGTMTVHHKSTLRSTAAGKSTIRHRVVNPEHVPGVIDQLNKFTKFN